MMRQALLAAVVCIVSTLLPHTAVAQPVAARLQATPTAGAADLEVTFSFRAQWDPRLGISADMKLDFGDGQHERYTQSVPRYIRHTYRQTGVFTATITLVDVVGNRARDSVTIRVGPREGTVRGRKLHADGRQVITATLNRNRAELQVVDTWAGEGLPLPPRLRELAELEEDKQRLIRKLDHHLRIALSRPNVLFPDARALIDRVLEGEPDDPRLRSHVEQILRQRGAMVLDIAWAHAETMLRQGDNDQATRFLDRLKAQAQEKFAGYYDVAELDSRINQRKRMVEFAQIRTRLRTIDDELEKTDDDNRIIVLEEEKDQLTERLTWLAKDQATWAGDRDRNDVAASRMLEAQMWQQAAENSLGSERYDRLNRAYNAVAELEREARTDDQRSIAALRRAQILARRGVATFSQDAAEHERRYANDLSHAADTFRRTERAMRGPGVDAYRRYVKREKDLIDGFGRRKQRLEALVDNGDISVEEYNRRLEAARTQLRTDLRGAQDEARESLTGVSSDERTKFATLLQTRSDIQQQFDRAQENQYRVIARSMGINAREARNVSRFRERVDAIKADWKAIQDLQTRIENCSGSNCETLQNRMATALNNIDTKWYSLYYDYQAEVHGDRNFNRKTYSPLTNRLIVFRRDANHPRKDVNVAFSEIEAESRYMTVPWPGGGIGLSAEEVVQLSATTAAVLASGVVSGGAGSLVARQIATRVSSAVARFAIRAVTEGVVFTATERYAVAPLMNVGLDAAGTDIRIGPRIKDSLTEELSEFASSSAANTAMFAFFRGANTAGAFSGGRAAVAAFNRTGSKFLSRAAEHGVKGLYEVAGLTGYSVLHEAGAAVAEGREFSWERAERGMRDGLAILPGLKLGGRMVESFTRPARTPADRRLVERRDGLLSVMRRNTRRITEEAARAESDAAMLGRLRRVNDRLANDILRAEARMVEKGIMDANVARGRASAIAEVNGTTRGIAVGAELGASAHGDVITVPRSSLNRLARDYARQPGTRVSRTRDGLLVEFRRANESVYFRGHTPREAKEVARQRRRERQFRSLGEYRLSRLESMTPAERNYHREVATHRYADLGRRNHSSPEVRDRAAGRRAAIKRAARDAGADIAPRPNLTASTGRRAQIRHENGRWKIEYDPKKADYLDVKEELLHFYNDVLTGRFRGDRGIAKTDAALAEVREASRRARHLEAVGEHGPKLERVYDRLTFEMARALETFERPGFERVDVLESLNVPHPPPEYREGPQLRAYGRIYNRLRNLHNEYYKRAEELEALRNHDEVARATTDRDLRDREITLSESIESRLLPELDAISGRRARLEKLLKLAAEPGRAKDVLAELEKIEPLELGRPKHDVIKPETNRLPGDLRFSSQTQAEFTRRYGLVETMPEFQSKISEQLGEATVVFGPARLTLRDITDRAAFVNRFKTAPADLPRKLISGLSRQTKRLLRQYPGPPTNPPQRLVDALLAHVNKLIESDKSVYHAGSFKRLQLEEGMEAFFKMRRRHAGHKDRRRYDPGAMREVNASAVRAAFPNSVAPSRVYTRNHPQAGPVLNKVLSDYPPDAVAVRLFDGLPAGPGVFDFAFAIKRGGKVVDVVVIETKGGDGTASTRVVMRRPTFFADRHGLFDAQQGTIEHSFSTLQGLRITATQFDFWRMHSDVSTIQDAINTGRFRYFVSRVETQVDNIRVHEVRGTRNWGPKFRRFDNQAAASEGYLSPPWPGASRTTALVPR